MRRSYHALLAAEDQLRRQETMAALGAQEIAPGYIAAAWKRADIIHVHHPHPLADVACLSSYHWHRVYHAVHGETIAATVKRLRLHRAAAFIADTGLTMKEVARRSGYDCRLS